MWQNSAWTKQELKQDQDLWNADFPNERRMTWIACLETDK